MLEEDRIQAIVYFDDPETIWCDEVEAPIVEQVVGECSRNHVGKELDCGLAVLNGSQATREAKLGVIL